ncbi:MAG: hypothetical protein M1834_001361 [Cirrosporium novae-zelandiae]|nr:MAG: hypothetical protein M1834_001361 [Cirrosporium novae-zelandiae]
MTTVKLPKFRPTPVESIPDTVSKLRDSFNSQKTKPVQFRLIQLRKLYWGLKDHEDEFIEACKRDLGKSSFETYLSEIFWCQNDILFMCDNLEKWVREEKAPDIPLTNALLRPTIRKDPLGCVLVIGAYNFPCQLSLGPMIGAIAAGCTVVLKPSEHAPNAAAVMEKVVRESLDNSCYTIVQGAIPESQALLKEKWDKIFFTGNPKTGVIISQTAASTLTPVTLELGGLNPAIVTKNADARLTAHRLLWGKVHNAGQVCVSQNYTLVDKEILPALVTELKTAFAEFFPDGAYASPDYGRINSDREFTRLKSMLDSTGGKILIGGTMNEPERFIEPTVIQCSSPEDSLITQESFGPFLPLLPVANLDEAIRVANSVHSSPLAVYPFGTKSETTRVLNEFLSGGATINDTWFHASIPTLRFGGVGTSGQGAYRGRESFETFTHRRSVVTTPNWMESLIAVRYPPYTSRKLKQLARMQNTKPNFDREGRVKSSLVWYLLTKGLWRALVLLLGAYILLKTTTALFFHSFFSADGENEL